MKFTFIQKLGLSILGILFITIFVNYLVKSAIQLRLQREKNADPDNAKYVAFRGKIQEGMDDPTDKIRDAFNAFGQIINNGINTLGAVMNTFAATIKNTFKMIGMYLDFVSMLNHLNRGILNHVICGGKEFESGFNNSMATIGILADCSWDKFVKFWNGTCTKYYITDMIFGIVHGILVELPCVLIFAITGIDLKPFVDLIYNVAILPIDGFVYLLTGLNITKWPDSVVNNCYRCTGTYTFQDKSVTVTKSFDEFAKSLNCTGPQISHGFIKIFQSIIPSDKWKAWVMGDNLSGSDDSPAF